VTQAFHALLPAPVRHVPVGSRTPRTSYAAMVEPIEIRELSRGEAPRGPDLPIPDGRRIVTRVVDGAIWRPIGTNDAFGEERRLSRDPVGPTGGEFVAWLEGRDAFRSHDDSPVGRCLEGTPFLARIPGRRLAHRPYGAWDVSRQGTLLLDGRDEAPGRAKAFAASELALIDGLPFMRMPGPLVFLDAAYERGCPRNVRIVAHPGAWTSQAPICAGNLYRFDRIKDLCSASRVRLGSISLCYDTEELGGYAVRDDDLAVMAREAVRSLAAGRWNEPAIPREWRERLLALSALGSVGAIDDDRLSDAWSFLRRFSDVGAEQGRPG
jgi:hypothetical protein